ncbi:MAG: hypothetical protein JWQ35_289 [Bacteriovoracaceae bacterium]|nr:hypothetical protein [Bacteriovoracaceae bacterium]
MSKFCSLFSCLVIVLLPIISFATEDTKFEGDLLDQTILRIDFTKDNVKDTTFNCKEHNYFGFRPGGIDVGPIHVFHYQNKEYQFGTVESCAQTQTFFEYLSQNLRKSVTLTIVQEAKFIQLVEVRK